MLMPTISTCPRCSQMVSIPEGLDAMCLVRCPLCGAEYPLNKAMDLAPPELIPVTTIQEAVTTPLKSTPETSSVAAPPIVPEFLSRFGHSAEGEENANPILASEHSADASEAPLDDEVFSIIAKHKAEVEKESPNQTESSALRRRPQRNPKSEVRIFIEVIFGGIMGLSVAYVAMAWFMGSQFPLPSPPKVLKPVLQFVLPDRLWEDKAKDVKR
jgi:hypothetical protein